MKTKKNTSKDRSLKAGSPQKVDQKQLANENATDLPVLNVDAAKLRATALAAEQRMDVDRLRALLGALKKTKCDVISENQLSLAIAHEKLLDVPRITASNAGEGKTSAVVYKFDPSQYQWECSDHFANAWLPERLRPHSPAAYIFQQCQQSGLNPTLEWWHAEEGPACGLAIILHW